MGRTNPEFSHTSFPQRVIRASLEGEMIFPQSGFITMIDVADQLLRASDEERRIFAIYEYSRTDIEHVMNAAIAFHQRNGISNLSDHEIEPILRFLTAQKEVIGFLLNFLLDLNGTPLTRQISLNPRRAMERLLEFLQDEQHAHTIQVATAFISTAVSVAHEATQLSQEYKEWVSERHQALEQEENPGKERGKIAIEVMQKYNPAFNELQTRILAEWQKICETLHVVLSISQLQGFLRDLI